MNYTDVKTTTLHFDQLNLIDKLSILAPYKLYNPSNFINRQINYEIISFVLLISVALSCAVVGAYTTISKPVNALDPNEDMQSKWDCTDNDNCNYYKSTNSDLELLNIESIGWKHALSLPLIGSVVLYGLYYGLTRLDKDSLMVGLNWYILGMSVFPNYLTYHYLLTVFTRKIQNCFKLQPIFQRYRMTLSKDVDNFPLGVVEPIDKTKFKKVLRHLRSVGVKVIKPNLIKTENQLINCFFDLKILVILPVSIFTSYGFFKFNPILNCQYPLSQTNWMISDILSINFAIFGINHTRISSFRVAFILLVGLFFYDIYFVFGTKVMVTVATGLDIPIKVLIPRSPAIYASNVFVDLYEVLTDSRHWDTPMSILGLGDIVIPGAFVALCLRYDLFKHHEANRKSFHHLQSYPKPYFVVSIISYFVGLLLTVSVLYVYQVGQPALLYIVPCLILGVSLLSLIRGEFGQILNYNEDIEEPNEEEPEYQNSDQDPEDEDSEYSVGDDSDWERLVEEKMEIDEDFEETDLDEIDLLIADQSNPIQVPITYEFESEDDDDTFIIVSDESSDSEEESSDEDDTSVSQSDEE